MGYKATLDIVIHLNTVRTKLFRRVGKIRYRMCLFYRQNQQKIFCRPYNILRDPNNNNTQQKYESQLDRESEYYYSKIHSVVYNDAKYPENQACYFRSYIDAYRLDKTQLNFKVELMFSPDNQNNFKSLGVFDAVIRKSHDISTYLPISFDQFEGFSISATYHATILDFKFQTQYVKKKDSQQQKPDFVDFWSFTEAATNGFRKNETSVFYEYYHDLLDHQLFSIQNRHSDLLRVNSINQNYPFVKLSANTGMKQLILGLSQYSSPPTSMKNQITNNIMSEFLGFKAIIYEKWNKLIQFVTSNSDIIANYYEKGYKTTIRDRLRINVFSHKISNHDWTYCKYEDSGKANIQHALADKKKTQDKQLWGQQFPVENTRFFGDQKRRIKIFQEKYIVNQQQLTQRSFKHNDSKLGITVKNRQNINLMSTQAQQNSIFQKPVSFKASLVGGLGYNISQTHNKKNNQYNYNPNQKPQMGVYENFMKQSHVIQNNHHFYHSAPRNFAQSTVGPISSDFFYGGKNQNFKLNDHNSNQRMTPIHRNQTHNNPFSYSQVSFPSNHQAPLFIPQSDKKSVKHGFLRKSLAKQGNNTILPSNFRKNSESINQKIQYKPTRKRSSGEICHIVVLVHGFQASRQDFFLIKSCLQIRYGIQVFISTVNEGRTEDSIQTLGKRLAMEINNFLANKDDDYKLSFVGHSLGGLIIRSALSFLDKIDSHLYTYISMSSPHLGYLYSPSALVQAGLWILNTWQKAQSLKQLCMSDASNLRDCYLYKLATQSTLAGFQKLIFVSSSQDEYTPYQSTRIQKNVKLLQERFQSTKGQVICEMVDSLLGRVKCSEISRINVIFDIQDKNLDAWIGRTAHIKYLSDKDFIKKFFIAFDQFFILPKTNE